MKYQFKFSLQLLDAIYMDSKIPLSTLQVDGGMTGNNLLMQLQADIVGIPVGKISNINFTSDEFCIDKQLHWVPLTASSVTTNTRL